MSKKKDIAKILPENIKNKIPYVRAFEEEGIIETEPGIFSKCYYVNDLLPENVKEYTPTRLNRKFRELLSFIPEYCSFQFVVHNRLYDESFFYEKALREITGFEKYRSYIDAYNTVIKDNAHVGHNNVKKDTYFVISMKSVLPEDAVKRFRDIDNGIKDAFKNVYSTNVVGLALKTRLKILYSMLNPQKTDFPDLSVKEMRKKKLIIKDLISPGSIDSNQAHKNYIVINNDVFARSFFISLVPSFISNSIISDITSISSSMLFSIQYDHMPVDMGFNVFSGDVAKNLVRRSVSRRDTLADRKLKRTDEFTQMVKHTEEDYFNNAALKVFKEGKAGETGVFACSIVITLFAEDLETLERDTRLLYISANKFAVQIKPLDLKQYEGFISSLPLCNCKVDVKRIYGLDRLSNMHPFNLSEIMKHDGLFYGLNAINDNIIFLNRKNFLNPAGVITGVEHCGKSFQLKREIFNGLISSDDRIAVVTMSDGYEQFIEKLGGTVVEGIKTNPFECREYYGLATPKGYSKSIMLEALFKDIISKNAENTVSISTMDSDETRIDIAISKETSRLINACTSRAADFSDPESIFGYMETHKESFELIHGIIPELKELTGNTQQSGGRLKLFKAGSSDELICILDYLWNRSLLDKEKGISYQVFIDPIDCLLLHEQGFDYLTGYIDKANKLKSLITMVVQSSVKLMSDNRTMIRLEELMNACGYFKLLNQGAIERRKYAEVLNIPNSLINYITNVDYGKGLILTPSSNIAFDDNFLGDERNAFYEIFK